MSQHVSSRNRQLPAWIYGLAVSLLLVLLLWLVIWFLYQSSRDALSAEIRAGLSRTAAVVATHVDVERHSELRHSEQQTSAAYREAIEPLRAVRQANERIRFVYTAIEQHGQIRFVLDAAPDDDPDAVALMQVYDDPNPEILRAFAEQTTVVSSQPYSDQWGSFLSAYVPLMDAEERMEAVLGIDLEVSEYLQRLAPITRASQVAAGFALLVAMTIGAVVWLQRRSDRQSRELSRQLLTVNAMLDVSQALGAEVELEAVLGVIIDKASEVLEAERASLFLYDREQRCLRGLVIQGAEASWFSLSLQQGIAGRAARTGELINVADAYQDSDFDPSFDRRSGFVTRSVLAMPLHDSGGDLAGVIQVLNRRDGKAFDRNDEVLLSALAAQARVALERARLTEAFVEKQLLDEALQLAHDIQMNMLPVDFTTPGGDAVDICASLTPAKAIGGDFYDLFAVGENRLCFVVADVSGKGIPAALFMAEAKTLIQALALTGLEPNETLFQANNILCRDNDASMFVTVFLGLLDLQSGEFRYSNAGHNLPYRLTGNGSVQPIAGAEAIALGAMEDFPFECESIQLQPGEGVYLYTDGVNEAMNPADEEFSQERLEALLTTAVSKDARQLTEATVAAVAEHSGDAEASDDLTVMVFRWLG